MGDWIRPQNDAEAEANDRALADAIKYARVVVTVGRNPDDPKYVAHHMSVDRDTGHVCLLQAAELLRSAADALEAAHGPGVC